MKDRNLKCSERVQASYDSCAEDLRKLIKTEHDGNEEGDEELGTFYEYGLAFDYVPRGTFKKDDGSDCRGYFRYQLSYGGPSEEFRFYVCEDLSLDYVEFWLLDWYDGASVEPEQGLIEDLWDLLSCGGSIEILRHMMCEAA